MQQTQTYRERSRAFLSKAREELRAGDLEQASEKGWGAAALMVKAVADERGKEHKQHRHLFSVVGDLVKETNDRELGLLFHVANDLHSNFYENWLSPEQVEQVVEEVERFVDKVERLL
jgi:uncharacterized protein (UPF0332 family)